LAAGGLLFVVATLWHPSQETPVSILASEDGLIGSHAVYFVSYVLILLGLPALYVSESQRMGTLGLIGLLVAFSGTALLAISSMFGFFAPVLAEQAPDTLDAIAAYPPVVIFNGLAAVGFMAGFVILGMAVAKSGAFPRWSGILIAVGAPTHLLGFGVAQLGSPALWFIAILGSVLLGSGLAWCGLRMWAKTAI
jgi:hypothetical protein